MRYLRSNSKFIGSVVGQASHALGEVGDSWINLYLKDIIGLALVFP
jgi:hypothetical protein